MRLNLLRLALKNIGSRRTRSWLTILGVLVGVTAVVALLSIGTGVQEAVLKQFADIGYDIILITPGGRAFAAQGAAGGFMPGSGAAGRFGEIGQTQDDASTSNSTPGTFSPQNPSSGTSQDTTGSTGTTNSTPGTFSPENLSGNSTDNNTPNESTTNQGTDQQTTPFGRFGEAGTRETATALDTEELLAQVPQLLEAGTLGTEIQPVETGTTSGYLRVSTPSLDFLQAFPSVLGGFKIASGTTFSNTTENEVVVGARSAELLNMSVGDSISINSIPFTVVGILAPSDQAGSRQDTSQQGDSENPLSSQGLAQSLGAGGSTDLILSGLTNTDDSLFVLNERATEVFPTTERMAVTITRVKQGVSISDTMAAINVAIGEQGASGTPVSIQEVADEIQGTLGLIETVLASIAAVALVVGGVGLMNTMYTAVLERTREIGILKSVGARDRQVMTLFLIDSGLMGLIGGALGLLLGSILSLFGTRLLGPSLGVGSFAPAIPGWLVGGVLVASFLLGALSGAWPAWRASRLNPVEALAAE